NLLVVDDDPLVANLVQAYFSSLGFNAEIAVSGREALQKSKQSFHHLFIIDINMPEMDGLELLENLDIKNRLSEAILITGQEDFKTAKQAIQLGAFGYLGKPLNFALLTGYVCKVFELIGLKMEKEQYLGHLEEQIKLRTSQLENEISERKRVDVEIHKKREELSHVNRIVTMNELTASLAHEINQPLTAILSNAQAALRFLDAEEPDLGEIRDALKDIVSDDKRAGYVINGLRAFLKKEESPLELLDLTGVIEEVLALTKSDMAIRNIVLKKELPAGMPLIQGNRTQLQQALVNLILNGCDAMADMEPTDTRIIFVRAFMENPGCVTVEISDRGCGLEKELLDHVFEPFFTTKPKGLGMGLAIFKSIIEAHGGTLRAANNPDKGATFGFTLPIEPKKP
ncbi:MAG: response regulator, partial [Chitinivibrionales bacterium]|nr:response regulator [Chitinivibrionales bacterium]